MAFSLNIGNIIKQVIYEKTSSNI